MKTHIRAHLLLFALTLAACCVLYPVVLYAIGQVAAPSSANGSLVAESGSVQGSHLIAQSFTDEAYFWPRPSAASYNAAAAGGSNFGASNPKLRERVTRQLGTLVKYKAGSASSVRTPQQDIEAWLATRPDRETLVPTDVAPAAAVFDLWASDPANAAKLADIEPVPADMVMASGSGLDPHITLRNALSVYQLDRVAAKRTPHGGDAKKVREEIAAIVRKHSFTPLTGLVGEPLVNVLNLNRELDANFPKAPSKAP
jgi:K+-transporting ATPase c subunit